MPIRTIQIKKGIRAFTYGNTGVQYKYQSGNKIARQHAYEKILKYVKAVHSKK